MDFQSRDTHFGVECSKELIKKVKQSPHNWLYTFCLEKNPLLWKSRKQASELLLTPSLSLCGLRWPTYSIRSILDILTYAVNKETRQVWNGLSLKAVSMLFWNRLWPSFCFSDFSVLQPYSKLLRHYYTKNSYLKPNPRAVFWFGCGVERADHAALYTFTSPRLVT